jgi:hypothetical protein
MTPEEIAAMIFNWLTGLDYELSSEDAEIIVDKYEYVAKLEMLVKAYAITPAILQKIIADYGK